MDNDRKSMYSSVSTYDGDQTRDRIDETQETEVTTEVTTEPVKRISIVKPGRILQAFIDTGLLFTHREKKKKKSLTSYG